MLALTPTKPSIAVVTSLSPVSGGIEFIIKDRLLGLKFLFITALPPVVENVSSTNDSSLSEHILLMFSDRTPSFLLKSPVRAAYAPLIALDFPPPLGPVIAVMPSRKVQSSS